jgi:hypothetical protein
MGFLTAFLAVFACAAAGGGRMDESIEVVVKGTLRTGVMAIGGETTGTTITARGATWELDLSGDPALRRKAESLAGQRAVVRGSLEVRPGVAKKSRWVVTVTSLEAPRPPTQ